MKISVIIPTYKPKDYFWECLDSLISQTIARENFEVIIVLNGCKDPWLKLIKDYIETYMYGMNINLIVTELAGVSNARNLALNVAKGEYITFIDDDDYVSPSYLYDLFEVASKDTISLCYPISFLDGENIFKPFYITKDYISNKFSNQFHWYRARRYFNGPVYKLIHRDIIGDRRFDTRFTNGEDSLFMFLISDRFQYVSYASKETIYFRRIRPGSAMTAQKSFITKLINETNLFMARTVIFISNPIKYSLRYYLRSILSSIRKLIIL